MKFRPTYEKRARNKFLDGSHYDRLIGGDEPVTIRKRNGNVLLMFLPGAVDRDICETARGELRPVGAHYSGNRKFNTGHLGYYSDRKHGCRELELSAANLRRWPLVLPFIQSLNDTFRQHLPERHAVQQSAADRLDRGWIVDGTCFTTTTVNMWDATHKARTPVHRDKGDLPVGFGVISVLRSGDYSGGELIFPEFKVAVDLKTTDVLLCDVHELHGNADIVPPSDPNEPWERIATISYFRTSMLNCPSRPSHQPQESPNLSTN